VAGPGSRPTMWVSAALGSPDTGGGPVPPGAAHTHRFPQAARRTVTDAAMPRDARGRRRRATATSGIRMVRAPPPPSPSGGYALAALGRACERSGGSGLVWRGKWRGPGHAVGRPGRGGACVADSPRRPTPHRSQAGGATRPWQSPGHRGARGRSRLPPHNPRSRRGPGRRTAWHAPRGPAATPASGGRPQGPRGPAPPSGSRRATHPRADARPDPAARHAPPAWPTSGRRSGPPGAARRRGRGPEGAAILGHAAGTTMYRGSASTVASLRSRGQRGRRNSAGPNHRRDRHGHPTVGDSPPLIPLAPSVVAPSRHRAVDSGRACD
jgi:hypothetical protein